MSKRRAIVPSAVIEATNKALRFAAEAKLDVIFVGSQVLFDSEAILEFYAVGEQDPMVGFVEASVTDKDDPSSGIRFARTTWRRPAKARPFSSICHA